MAAVKVRSNRMAAPILAPEMLDQLTPPEFDHPTSPKHSDNTIIIHLPAELHAVDPRMLAHVTHAEYEEVMIKINQVVNLARPKMHLAVTYLASRWIEYGISAQCSGTVLILELPEMRNPLQNLIYDSAPQLRAKSGLSRPVSPNFATKLGTLMKKTRLTSSRCGAVIPLSESPRPLVNNLFIS